MAAKSMLKILTEYFNVEPHKVPMKAWSDEMKALSPDEKRELAEGVCVITGDTIAAK
jgi:hypothetical protein